MMQHSHTLTMCCEQLSRSSIVLTLLFCCCITHNSLLHQCDEPLQLFHKLDSLTEPLEPPVAAVLKAERSVLLNGESLEAFVTALQSTVAPAAATTLSGRVDIARAVAVTQGAAVAAQVVLSGGVSGRGVSAKSCAAALKVLEKELSVGAAAAEFKVHTQSYDLYCHEL
jgi:hypothetical protein